MRVIEALKQLKEDDKFKEWQQSNPGFFLVHVFIMIEQIEKLEAEHLHQVDIGFYDPKQQKMVSFIVGEDVELKEHDEVFKQPDTEILGLDEAKIKTKLAEVLKIVEDLRKEKYKQQVPVKKIVILQNLKDFGNCWNITYVTAQFKTLNIKVDSEKGKILDDKLVEIMQFGAS